MYKEKIYQAMDSFLTESTDLKEKPIIRSVETLNKDRHLFVEKMEEIIQQVVEDTKAEVRKEIENKLPNGGTYAIVDEEKKEALMGKESLEAYKFVLNGILNLKSLK